MTFYEQEVRRIRGEVYANKGQVDMVRRIRNYINDHYDEEMSLGRLSETQFVSKYHLIRLFKKYYGQTPMQYLTEKRIEISKEYLRIGTNVTETCFATGFESPCSFSTLFKSKTGRTPTDFQKRAIFAKPPQV